MSCPCFGDSNERANQYVAPTGVVPGQESMCADASSTLQEESGLELQLEDAPSAGQVAAAVVPSCSELQLAPQNLLQAATSANLQSAFAGIGERFSQLASGIKMEFSLFMPVQLVFRVLMNGAAMCTKGTDIGVIIAKMTQSELTKMQEGISVLRSADLKTADDQLWQLLNSMPTIQKKQAVGEINKKMIKKGLKEFVSLADTCVHDANKAFNTVETPEQKIRAVVIACAAIQAKSVDDGNRDQALIRSALGAQIRKLLLLETVRRDIKNQFDELPTCKFLDFPKERVSRLNSTVGVIVHAEVWAASHRLQPIMTSEFVTHPFSIKKLVETGLLNGAKSANQLQELTEEDGTPAFSQEELCILGGFCDTPLPVVPDSSLEEVCVDEYHSMRLHWGNSIDDTSSYHRRFTDSCILHRLMICI